MKYKILKWISILFLSLIAVIVTGFLILTIKNKSFIESSDKQFVEYLNRNKILLDDNTVDNSRHLFDEGTYKSNVILLGESHGLADIQTIDKSLFLHLNKKTGFRYYVAEMDSIRANQLNTFLNGAEKDTTLLKQVVVKIGQRIPQQAGRELYQKWSDIYDYNQTLPDSLKLCVIGVDTDFDAKSSISRDSAMTVNFLDIVKRKGLENEQFYGLFGLFHILQNGINKNNSQPFASRLKSKGCKVTSILCLNIDSEMYFPKNEQFPTPPNEKTGLLNMDGPLVLVKGINDLKDASDKNTNTLFNLVQTNSPYFGSLKLTKTKSNFIGLQMVPYDEQLSTPDFFQYVILVRNSKALSPLK
jgi:hypothetical protein